MGAKAKTFMLLMDGWVEGKDVSMSVSKLFQVIKYIYKVLFIKLPSAEKYNLQGIFIPFPPL